MRVFLTGASGYVGRAVAAAFGRAGASVTGLVRTEEKAEAFRRLGFKAVVGNLRDPHSYRSELRAHDVIVHAAFEYDAGGKEVLSTEETVVATLIEACADADTPRHLIYTSNAFLLGDLGESPVDEGVPVGEERCRTFKRLELERAILRADGRERLSTAAIRLGAVYGEDGGTISLLFSLAADRGQVPVWGSGKNRWSLIYLHDLADLYVTIARQTATGVFHGVDGHPLRVDEVAREVSGVVGYGGETLPVSADEARAEYGEHFNVLLRDVAVLPARSRALGWKPRFNSLREGLDTAYEEWRALHRPPPGPPAGGP